MKSLILLCFIVFSVAVLGNNTGKDNDYSFYYFYLVA